MKATYQTQEGDFIRCVFMDNGIVSIDPYEDKYDSIGIHLDYFIDIVKNEKWKMIKLNVS